MACHASATKRPERPRTPDSVAVDRTHPPVTPIRSARWTGCGRPMRSAWRGVPRERDEAARAPPHPGFRGCRRDASPVTPIRSARWTGCGRPMRSAWRGVPRERDEAARAPAPRIPWLSTGRIPRHPHPVGALDGVRKADEERVAWRATRARRSGPSAPAPRIPWLSTGRIPPSPPSGRRAGRGAEGR